MKRFFIILTIISLLIGSAYADNSITDKGKGNPSTIISIKGIVLDEHTGEALAGVKVVVTELDQEVYTDLDGNFEFENLLKDTYNIETEMISYEKQSLKVDIGVSDDLKIMMENK